MVGVVIVARALKNISILINIVGSSAGIILVYVFPVILHNLNETDVS